MSRSFALSWLVALALVLAPATRVFGQQGPAGDDDSFSLPEQAPPRATVGYPYDFQLHAQGGAWPLHWSVEGGQFPPGLGLSAGGHISGTPEAAGGFRFTVTVTDSSRPPRSRSRELVVDVRVPLVLAWKQAAQVEGDHIAGAVLVSNQSPETFDLTYIVVAVNEYGKAFALGYQHGPLAAGIERQEFTFDSSLPNGRYVVHVDVVAEVAARNLIHRARLQTPDALIVPAPRP